MLRDLPPEDQALASAGLHLGIAADEHPEEPDLLVRGILGADRDSAAWSSATSSRWARRCGCRCATPTRPTSSCAGCCCRARGGGPPSGGALLFTCNGRGRALFGPGHGGADHDPRVVRRGLAPQGVAGFFAGGEIGPVAGRNHLHGFTASLLLLP